MGVRPLIERLRHGDLARRQRPDMAEPLGLAQVARIVAGIDRAENQLAQAAGDHRCAMTTHQHHGMAAERAGERGAFLRLDHQQVGVAEIVAAVPERRHRAHGGAEMKHRDHRVAADAERHDGGGVMVADGEHVGPCLVDLAVDDALGIELHGRRLHRLGVQGEFENVVGLDQRRRARPRQQIAIGVAGMTDADMAEGVDDAFMAENAVGDGEFMAQLRGGVGHGNFLSLEVGRAAACSNAETRPATQAAGRFSVSPLLRLSYARISVDHHFIQPAPLLPRPACGERVGVRGPIHDSERNMCCSDSRIGPTPDRYAIRPLPARGER